MNARPTLLAAGLLGVTGVALGAFGAHALKDLLLERGMTTAWETGSRYQLLHAVALLGATAWLRSAPGSAQRWLSRAATCWVAGITLFSGSLYLLAAGGPRWLGPITPLGGLALMAGWICVVVAASTKES
jgi:uncharacterized membrane protein YgdD (TMEM256/DUF423 family)